MSHVKTFQTFHCLNLSKLPLYFTLPALYMSFEFELDIYA